MNTNVKKSGKNYDHLAGSLVMKLLKNDPSLKMFFNILEPSTKKVNLQEIKDTLKQVYPVNKSSIKSLNLMLKKYKVVIDTKQQKVNTQSKLPIQNKDIYMPTGYRQHGKVISIYNRNHLPMVIV
jgi:hypothetical protein